MLRNVCIAPSTSQIQGKWWFRPGAELGGVTVVRGGRSELGLVVGGVVGRGEETAVSVEEGNLELGLEPPPP